MNETQTKIQTVLQALQMTEPSNDMMNRIPTIIGEEREILKAKLVELIQSL